ncbi:MAG: hypothetical protein PVSMB1_05770 [Gemmatimonadaceae bacterium]
MGSTASPAQGDRWLRAIGYGLLAEVSTIVTIIAAAMVYRYVFARGQAAADYAVVNDHIGAAIGVIGGTLYTFLFARALMRHVSTRFIPHGIVVALAAIALSVGGSIAGHHGVPAAYMMASALKIIAGALAGFLAG